jgi:hypothetical protein
MKLINQSQIIYVPEVFMFLRGLLWVELKMLFIATRLIIVSIFPADNNTESVFNRFIYYLRVQYLPHKQIFNPSYEEHSMNAV